MRTRFAVLCLLSSFAWCPLPAVARAELVIFKDGFALQGKVFRQGTTVFEPGIGLVQMAKLNGFFMIEDECRRTIFSYVQVEDVDKKETNREAGLMRITRNYRNVDNWKFPANAVFLGFTPFDTQWERTLTLDTPEGRRQIPQRLVILTPETARVESLRYRWGLSYVTRELFEPDAIRPLLVQHPDLKMTGTEKDGERRLLIFRFLLQGGWYDQAERELDGILKEHPDQKDKVDSGRDSLRRRRGLQALDDLERKHKAGQHQAAERALASFAPQGPDDEGIQSRAQALRTRYESLHDTLTPTRRLLQDLPARLEASPHRELLAEAVWTILGELGLDNAARLEAFLPLAQQAERAAQLKHTPDHKPEQLAALAVTGWLLG